MKLITCLVPIAAVALLAGCSPRKEPKPSVSTKETATYAAANEGALPSPDAVKAGGSTVALLPVVGPAPAWKLKDLSGNPHHVRPALSAS